MNPMPEFKQILRTTLKTSLVSMIALFAVRAQCAPQIQKEAAYFNDLQSDLAWFASAQKELAPNDTRALFLRVYESVSLEMVNMFAEKQFQHPEWVNSLMLKYVSLYKNALDCNISGACAVSPAWQKAFDENRAGKVTPAGQLLLSISAHVNRDLPVALASLESTKFDDPTYHQDFEKISTIFQRRMPDLIQLVKEYQSCNVNTVDEKIIRTVIQHAISITRDKSWNWGAKLAAAQSSEDEKQIMTAIEQHAHNEDLSLFVFAPGPAYLICL
jgi:hypothetical protein